MGKFDSFKRKIKKIKIKPIYIYMVVFVICFLYFYFNITETFVQTESYSMGTFNSTFPIIYQLREERLINEMRGFSNEEYRIVANDKITILNADRQLFLLIKKNKSKLKNFEYEIRDDVNGTLIERTKIDIIDIHDDIEKNEIKVTLNIQNLIKQNTSYVLTLKITLENNKKIYYFANIINKKNTNLDKAIEQVEDFTRKTFNPKEATELVKYLETSVNRDSREMYNVTLQQTFEQLTFADTKMELVSDLYYDIYQAQDYSYSIVVNFLSKSGKKDKNEYFLNRDEYVLRWDGKRWYYMKFNRETEEILDNKNLPYNVKNHRFYTGVTNPKTLVKKESQNKKYFAFSKKNQIFFYDVENNEMTNIFSYKINDENSFQNTTKDYEVKLMDVSNEGIVTYMVYGYNMSGYNEGNIGVAIYTYDILKSFSEERIFIPIYSTFQSIKYDFDKLCILKNNRLIFKSYNKVYSIDIDTAEILTLAEDFDEIKFAASDNGNYFAFNNEKEEESKHINIYNINDGEVKVIDAGENENIEVVTFMNDDLFYSVYSDANIWREQGKIIGRPSHEIRVINAVTGKEDLFREEGKYLYNFVNKTNVLNYNKYSRNGTHYTYISNDVIVNNFSIENTDKFFYKEEYTKEKLRIGYIEIPLKYNENFIYGKNADIIRKQVEYTALNSEKEEDTIYYVYDSGKLKAKLKNISDGIDEIRENYGYVKINNRITCYNRANKGNVSYLRQNNSILENIKGFEENIYLKDGSTLVMNVTGVTERDLEYYISLNEKVAVFKDDKFKYFITGYDNNNYVLEYENKDRILTPRNEVAKEVVYGGNVLFAQLENLE